MNTTLAKAVNIDNIPNGLFDLVRSSTAVIKEDLVPILKRSSTFKAVTLTIGKHIKAT